MNFTQSFRLAIKSLLTSKMRALLTMLGIIIGVGAVIVITSLGNGMQQMMKQAKAMQKKMMAEHEELAKQEFIGKAPDDMVTATFTGDNTLVDLKIKPEAVDPDDVDMLQDLVVAAINDGMKQVNDATQQKLGKYTRGMGM